MMIMHAGTRAVVCRQAKGVWPEGAEQLRVARCPRLAKPGGPTGPGGLFKMTSLSPNLDLSYVALSDNGDSKSPEGFLA